MNTNKQFFDMCFCIYEQVQKTNDVELTLNANSYSGIGIYDWEGGIGDYCKLYDALLSYIDELKHILLTANCNVETDFTPHTFENPLISELEEIAKNMEIGLNEEDAKIEVQTKIDAFKSHIEDATNRYMVRPEVNTFKKAIMRAFSRFLDFLFGVKGNDHVLETSLHRSINCVFSFFAQKTTSQSLTLTVEHPSIQEEGHPYLNVD